MLGERSDQRGLWEADRLYLDHVGRESFYGLLASLRGQLFRDADFAEFYCPDNGRDSVPPSLLATALLLQSHDKVSDAEAKARADFDLRWKVALGIEAEFGEYSEPLIIAYGANRFLGEQNLTKGEIDPIRSRLPGETELYDIEEILSTLDYASIANKNKGDEYDRREELKKAIARILPGTEFSPTDIKILPPTLNKQKLSGVCLRTEFGKLVPFSSLSLGYQTTMAWVADLAWRLLKHYPKSPNPLEEPAVVLIDEIDLHLHLHPRWQLRIMEDLSAVFLRTQFIATSHSPLMVQVAEKANVALLRRKDTYVEIYNDPRRVKSWRVDQILTSDLFGVPSTRNEQTESLFSRRDQLVTKSPRTPEEDAELEGLYVEISKIPSAGDPQDQRAMELIREASALLKQHGIIEP